MIENEILRLIQRHWRKAAWGTIIFLVLRFLIVTFFGWWILSTVLERRQQFKEDRDAFEAAFQEETDSFEKEFNETGALIKMKQREIKEELEQVKYA